MVLQLGRKLREGASEAEVAAYLDSAEAALIGVSQVEKNRGAARLVKAWYSSETGEPSRTRWEAIEWAIAQAKRIVDGDVVNRMDVFDLAQRMELVLCEHQWLDDGYPTAIRPFVWGWNVSDDKAIRDIRQAAAALASDPSLES